MKKGFTLIELLVTSSIIMIMLGVTITYSQKGEGINRLNRSVERLSFDIRRVSNLSTQTRQLGDKKVCGWGIYLNDKNSYIVFSDFCDSSTINGDKVFSENEIYEMVKLDKGVEIKDTNALYLIYLPPEPRLEIYDEFNNKINEGNILIANESNKFSKTLNINQLGVISIK